MRVTKQRQVILEELCKLKSHPTADEVYHIVRQRLPRISLGTVYRNLDILSGAGTIQKIDVGGSQRRFDGNADTHYHIRCSTCNKVDDLEMEPDMAVERQAGAISGYLISRHHIEFVGLCPQCQNKGLAQNNFGIHASHLQAIFDRDSIAKSST